MFFLGSGYQFFPFCFTTLVRASGSQSAQCWVKLSPCSRAPSVMEPLATLGWWAIGVGVGKAHSSEDIQKDYRIEMDVGGLVLKEIIAACSCAMLVVRTNKEETTNWHPWVPTRKVVMGAVKMGGTGGKGLWVGDAELSFSWGGLLDVCDVLLGSYFAWMKQIDLPI